MSSGEDADALDEQNKRYLVYEKTASGEHTGHAVVHLIRAPDLMKALLRCIQIDFHGSTLGEDGSITVEGLVYEHPLAYIEAEHKIYGEWQIRELPDWTLDQLASEVFCGESSDGTAEIITICRKELLKKLPRSRARAFVWYLRGRRMLVTFYRKAKPFRIEIVARFLWTWDGVTEQVTEWTGDYPQLMSDLNIDLIRGDPSLP